MPALAYLSRLDLFLALTTAASFALFLVVHVLAIRYLQLESSLRTLMRVFAGCVAVNLAVGLYPAVWPMAALGNPPWPSVVVGALASTFILANLAFIYVTWIFNLGETARRIRVLRELAQAPSRALTLEEIYRVYNADIILRTRLARLERAGQLEFDGRAYRVGSRFFLMQARGLWTVKAILGIPEDRF